ncbi:MAG: hypothetical protein EU550_01070 [Promethearchaeota archaeon]|nr:MAG: hypothetical protein EU550_01070 [Candidatus Lokiarchaeota archaeon]
MEYHYYVYEKPEYDIRINKMPIWFKEIKFEGDKNKGYIEFHTQDNYDEFWGPIAKYEFNWESKYRTEFFHSREVQESINIYNAINISVTNKDSDWIRSHEYTYWFGNRMKRMGKKYYPENSIHGLFYCELTERVFEMHTTIIRDYFESYREYILNSYKSVFCHD